MVKSGYKDFTVFVLYILSSQVPKRKEQSNFTERNINEYSVTQNIL